jgi:hypothetical protein
MITAQRMNTQIHQYIGVNPRINSCRSTVGRHNGNLKPDFIIGSRFDRWQGVDTGWQRAHLVSLMR